MQNAKKFNDRITIGLVPGLEDIKQLKEMGYKTLIDLRDTEELFDGFVEKHARHLGLKYINIPVQRDAIQFEAVKTFYEQVFAKGSAPLYLFSRLGRKPLVFILLFEAVVQDQPIIKIYRQASRLGFHLEGDFALQKFLYSLHNSEGFKQLVETIRQSRSDLFHDAALGSQDALQRIKNDYSFSVDRVTEMLLEMTTHFANTKNSELLCDELSKLLASLKAKRV